MAYFQWNQCYIICTNIGITSKEYQIIILRGPENETSNKILEKLLEIPAHDSM